MKRKLTKVHKATMLKQVRNNKSWTGYIAPSNVNEFHVNQGWALGMEIMVTGDKEQYYVETHNSIRTLEDFIDDFKSMRCYAELGRNVRFWQVEPAEAEKAAV